MGLMKEAAKLAEDQLKKDRAEMAKRNAAQMEELAKIQPTPTITELQKAMGLKITEVKVEAKPEAKAMEAKPEAKAMEAKPVEKSGYVTRETTSASKK